MPNIHVLIKDHESHVLYNRRVSPCLTVQQLKNDIALDTGVPASKQRVFFRGAEMANARTVLELSQGPEDTVRLTHSVRESTAAEDRFGRIELYGNARLSSTLRRVVREVRTGFSLRLRPELAMDGTGGTYFLRDARRRRVACFKPRDEEPFAHNNPRDMVGVLGTDGFSRGVLSGEAAEREVAAYALDRAHFAGVPPTARVEISHPAFHYADGRVQPKVGSLQAFVEHNDVASDLACTMFDELEVQKIAVLDLRLVNTDRNDANILVRNKENPDGSVARRVLVPIDHGYCLPDRLQVAWCDLCWYDWPQVKAACRPEVVEFVRSLDVDEDARMLQEQLQLRKPCLIVLRAVGRLLKLGVEAGLTLHAIASMVVRTDLAKPSPLERVCADAYALARAARRQRLLSTAPRMLGLQRFLSTTAPHLGRVASADLTASASLLLAAHAETTATGAAEELAAKAAGVAVAALPVPDGGALEHMAARSKRTLLDVAECAPPTIAESPAASPPAPSPCGSAPASEEEDASISPSSRESSCSSGVGGGSGHPHKSTAAHVTALAGAAPEMEMRARAAAVESVDASVQEQAIRTASPTSFASPLPSMDTAAISTGGITVVGISTTTESHASGGSLLSEDASLAAAGLAKSERPQPPAGAGLAAVKLTRVFSFAGDFVDGQRHRQASLAETDGVLFRWQETEDDPEFEALFLAYVESQLRFDVSHKLSTRKSRSRRR